MDCPTISLRETLECSRASEIHGKSQFFPQFYSPHTEGRGLEVAEVLNIRYDTCMYHLSWQVSYRKERIGRCPKLAAGVLSVPGLCRERRYAGEVYFSTVLGTSTDSNTLSDVKREFLFLHSLRISLPDHTQEPT